MKMAIQRMIGFSCSVVAGPLAFRDDLTYAYVEGPESLKSSFFSGK